MNNNNNKKGLKIIRLNFDHNKFKNNYEMSDNSYTSNNYSHNNNFMNGGNDTENIISRYNNK